EPVAARPPSNLYRFQKLARRNKLAFGAAVAVATALALGVLVSTWQAVRATQARHEANRQRTAAEQATRAADNAQRASAEQLVHLSGWQSCEAGDSLDALVWFTEALYLSQNNPTSEELQRIRLGCLLQNTPKLVQVGFLAGPAKDVEFSPDGRQLVTACEDGTVRVWDSITGKAITPPIQHRGTVRQATFSPDGRLILTASGQWRHATRQA